MLQTIIDAINNRQVLSFTYSGLPRVVEPYAVGVSTAGHDVLRCYQTQGRHITPGHEWDLCALSKIRDLAVTGAVFVTARADYRRGDKQMTHIYAQF